MRKNGYGRYVGTVYEIIRKWEQDYWERTYPGKEVFVTEELRGIEGEYYTVFYEEDGNIIAVLSHEEMLLAYPNGEEIHKELQSSTGIQVSYSTTQKCLRELRSTEQVARMAGGGRGNSQKYCIAVRSPPVSEESILSSKDWIEKGFSNLPESLYTHFKWMQSSLLFALKRYSDACVGATIQQKKFAEEDFNNYLKKVFLDSAYKLRFQVEPPYSLTKEQMDEIINRL